MAGGTGGEGEFGLQIAPMLDILFVLLLFFMVSAGAQKKETALLAPLPGKGTGPIDKAPIRLDVDDNGAVTFNDQTLDPETSHDMPNLVKKLKGLIQSTPNQPVVISPANSTTQERVVDVLDACKAANVKNIAFGSLE